MLLLVAGDLAARAYAEARTQQEVNHQSGANLDVQVHIHSFPFVGRLLASGQVSRVTASAAEVHDGPIAIHALQLDLHEVHLDRNKTMSNRRIFLKSIGKGSMSGELTADGLSAAFGLKVEVVDGAVEVTVAGHTLRTEVAMKNGVLTLSAAGITLPSVTLPISGLLPCHPSATLGDDRIRLACSFEKIPPRLIELVNGVAAHV